MSAQQKQTSNRSHAQQLQQSNGHQKSKHGDSLNIPQLSDNITTPNESMTTSDDAFALTVQHPSSHLPSTAEIPPCLLSLHGKASNSNLSHTTDYERWYTNRTSTLRSGPSGVRTPVSFNRLSSLLKIPVIPIQSNLPQINSTNSLPRVTPTKSKSRFKAFEVFGHSNTTPIPHRQKSNPTPRTPLAYDMTPVGPSGDLCDQRTYGTDSDEDETIFISPVNSNSVPPQQSQTTKRPRNIKITTPNLEEHDVHFKGGSVSLKKLQRQKLKNSYSEKPQTNSPSKPPSLSATSRSLSAPMKKAKEAEQLRLELKEQETKSDSNPKNVLKLSMQPEHRHSAPHALSDSPQPSQTTLKLFRSSSLTMCSEPNANDKEQMLMQDSWVNEMHLKEDKEAKQMEMEMEDDSDPILMKQSSKEAEVDAIFQLMVQNGFYTKKSVNDIQQMRSYAMNEITKS